MKKHVRMTFYLNYDVVVDVPDGDEELAKEAAYEEVRGEIASIRSRLINGDLPKRPDYEVDDDVESYEE